MNELKDAVLALIGVDDQVAEPEIPYPPDVSVAVLVCPHCACRDCETWSTTEATLATCPECGAEFNPPVNESKAAMAMRKIEESRARLNRSLNRARPKMELHRFLK